MKDNDNLKFKDIVDSTLLVGTFTGFIYSLGYVFYLNYYTHFNIPVEVIPDIEFNKTLVRGFFVLLDKLPFLTVFSGIIILCLVLFKNCLRRRSLFKKIFQLANSYRYLISIVILVFTIFYCFPEARDSGLGRARFDAWNLTRVNVSFKSDINNIKIQNELCLLTILKDHFVFFEPVENARIKPMVFLIKKQDISHVVLNKYYGKPK